MIVFRDAIVQKACLSLAKVGRQLGKSDKHITSALGRFRRFQVSVERAEA